MTFAMYVLWVLAGLLAGALAGFVLKRGGYGLIGDVILGLVGSVVATGIFSIAGLSPAAGLLTIVVVAFAGAAGVIVAQRRFWPAVA